MAEVPESPVKNGQPTSDVPESVSEDVTKLAQDHNAERRRALAELAAYDQEIGI